MKSDKVNFNLIPENLEDITAAWCQKLLHEGLAINKETMVTRVEVMPITENGLLDGGGLSGSNLLKLIPTYG